MSKNVSKNHGELRVRVPAKKQVPMPRLAVGKSFRYNLDADEERRIYRLWRMRALKAISVAGNNVNEGEEFLIPLNQAAAMAHAGTAEFVDADGRIAKETALLEEMEKLGMDKPVDIRKVPEFQPQQDGVHGWNVQP